MVTRPALAYPEFQVAVQRHSGRVVSCALCHTHPEGPDGLKHGQIGSLGPEEQRALSVARAFVPGGPPVDSPILNGFGDSMLTQLGRDRLASYRAEPMAAIGALDQTQDLDHDSIPDASEVREGTHPLDPRHGNPWRLFVHNLSVHWFELVMLAGATALGLFGLNHLLRWFANEAELALQRSAPREEE